jgi:hypothetical protein
MNLIFWPSLATLSLFKKNYKKKTWISFDYARSERRKPNECKSGGGEEGAAWCAFVFGGTEKDGGRED